MRDPKKSLDRRTMLAGAGTVGALAAAAAVLPAVQGRMGGSRRPGVLEFSTHNLHFTTGDGLRWPGGNLRLKLTDEVAQIPVLHASFGLAFSF